GYFTWLAKEGCIDTNPVAFTNKAQENGARERVLADNELRTVWLALDDSEYATIIKLLMLTGARRDEIGGLRWNEIDLNEATVPLPPARTKSARAKKPREHLITLSEPALAILKAQPRRTNPDGTPRDHVFGRGIERGFQGWSRSKAELDARITRAHHGKAL